MKFRIYPALVDIYLPTVIGQDESGEIQKDYTTRMILPCDFRAVRPESHLETFGERYSDRELIVVEIPPKDAADVSLDCKAARLRHKSKDIFYYPDCIFDISGINPLVDYRGHPFAVQLFCELSEERRGEPEELTPLTSQ